MKTSIVHVPVTVALPREYSIEVKLDGGRSTLTLRETYPEDIPPGMLERTIEFFRTMTPRGELSKVGENVLILKLTGPEFDIAQCLAAEMRMVAEAYRWPTVSPMPLVPGRPL